MDLEKLEKYIDYIISEIDRRLDSKAFDDNSLIQLTLELDKLKKIVANSDLPEKFKSSINAIESKYSIKKTERNALISIAFLLTFGTYYYIHQLKIKSNRKDYLINLRHYTNTILYQIRTE